MRMRHDISKLGAAALTLALLIVVGARSPLFAQFPGNALGTGTACVRQEGS